MVETNEQKAEEKLESFEGVVCDADGCNNALAGTDLDLHWIAVRYLREHTYSEEVRRLCPEHARPVFEMLGE